MSSLNVSLDTSLIQDSSSIDQLEISVDMTNSIPGLRQSSKRRKNVREAIIAEDEGEKERPKPKLASSFSSSLGKLLLAKIIVIQM